MECLFNNRNLRLFFTELIVAYVPIVMAKVKAKFILAFTMLLMTLATSGYGQTVLGERSDIYNARPPPAPSRLIWTAIMMMTASPSIIHPALTQVLNSYMIGMEPQILDNRTR